MKLHTASSASFLAIAFALSAFAAPHAAEPSLFANWKNSLRHPAATADGSVVYAIEEQDGIDAVVALRPDRNGTWTVRKNIVTSLARIEDLTVSPDGRHIAFVSFQDDALGDVYVHKIGGRAPRVVSLPAQSDRMPRFRDNDTLSWTAAAPGADPREATYTISSGSSTTLDEVTPFPTVTGFPAIAIDATGSAALAIPSDTNGDGVLNEYDAAAIFLLTNGVWRQQSQPMDRLRGIGADNRTAVTSLERGQKSYLVRVEETRQPAPSNAGEVVSSAWLGQELHGTDPRIGLRNLLNSSNDAAVKSAALELLIEEWLRRDSVAQPAAFLPHLQAFTPSSDGDGQSLSAASLYWQFASRTPALRGTSRRTAVEEVLTALDSLLGSEGADLAAALSMRVLRTEGEFDRALELHQRAASQHGSITASPILSAELAAIYSAMGRPEPAREELQRALLAADLSPITTSWLLEQYLDILALVDPARTRLELLLRYTRDLESNPHTRALLRLRLAQEYVASGRASDAITILSEAGAQQMDDPQLNALLALNEFRAHRAADNLSAAWNHALAMRNDGTARVLQGAGVDAALEREFATSGVMRVRQLLSLYDPELARSVAYEVIKEFPNSAEAWRLFMAASAETGASTAEMLSAVDDLSLAGDQLWYYLRGLALSYDQEQEKQAAKLLRESIHLGPSFPYAHQTLGFLSEARWRRDESRDRQREDDLEAARDSYERASDAALFHAPPYAQADLALNSGNIAYESGLFSRAVSYYAQVAAANTGFSDPRTEFLYNYRYGIASFRAGSAARAVEQFDAAAAGLERLTALKLVPESQAVSLALEIEERSALCLLESGAYTEALAAFEAISARLERNSISFLRNLRTRSHLHLLIAMETLDARGRIRNLEESLIAAREALALAPSVSAMPRSETSSGALFTFDMQVSMGSGGDETRLSLSMEDETRLLHSLVAKASQEIGDSESAAGALAAIGALPSSSNPADIYEETLALSNSIRNARLLSDSGRPGAAKAVLAGIASGINPELEAEIPGYNMLLAQAFELWSRASSTSDSIDDSPLIAWARAALQRDADPAYMLALQGTRRMQLQLMLNLHDERRFRAASTTRETLDAMLAWQHGLRAFDAEFALAPGGAEANLLSLINDVSRLRFTMAAGMDAPAAVGRLATKLRANGFQALEWWVRCQPLLAGEAIVDEAAVLGATLDSLLAIPPGGWPRTVDVPWELLSMLEQRHLAALEGDVERLWSAVEGWNIVRRRLLLEVSDEGPAQRPWTTSFVTVRDVLRSSLETWRATPFSDESLLRIRSRTAQRAEESLRAHLQRDPGAPLNWRHTVLPQVPFASISAFLGANTEAARAVRLVLAAETDAGTHYFEWRDGSWSPSSAAAISAPDNRLTAVMTNAPGSAPEGALIIESGSLLLDFLSKPRFLSTEGCAELQAGAPAPGAPHVGVTCFTLGDELTPNAQQPAYWRAGSAGRLADVLASYPDATDIRLWISSVDASRMQLEALAANLAAGGFRSARINGVTFGTPPLDPRHFEGLATARLATIGKDALAALQANQIALAVPRLEAAVSIKRALGRTDSLPTDFEVLATQHSLLGNWEVAAQHAGAWVAQLQENGAAPDEVARAVALHAGYASQAGLADESAMLFGLALDAHLELGDNASAARMAIERARSLENANQFIAALSAFHTARSAFEELGDAEQEVAALFGAARLERRFFNNYRKSIDLLQEIGPVAAPAGLNDARLEALLNISRNWQKLGEFDNSRTALAEFESLSAQHPPAPRLIAEWELENANLNWYQSLYTQALDHVDTAQRIQDGVEIPALDIAIGNTEGLVYWSFNKFDRAGTAFRRSLQLAINEGIMHEVSSTRNNLGILYRSMEQYEMALEQHVEAARIDAAQGNRWGVAYDRRNAGLALMLLGRFEEARSSIEEAVKLSTEIGDEVNSIKSRLALAQVHEALGETAKAAALFSEVRGEAATAAIPEVEWRALHGLARLADVAGDLPAAEAHLRASITVIDSMRASIRAEELLDGFLDDKQTVYDELVSVLIRRGQPREALDVSESARGRQLIDLLAGRSAGTGSPSKPQPISTIQPLISAGDALVIYHLLDDSLAIWVVDRASMELRTVDVERQELVDLITDYRDRLQDFSPLDAAEDKMSAWLIAPIEDLIAGKGRLCFVPHRAIHQVPFAALRLANGNYVIDAHPVYNVPSASVLAFSTERRGAARDGALLALGNPDLGDPTFDLPFAQREVERLGLEYRSATILTGAEATKAAFLSGISSAGRLHIASHGIYNNDAPMESGLFLAGSSPAAGFLSAADIFGANIIADLVVLSACQSGLGRIANGDEIIGLNRAFLAAGAHKLVSTLWRVDDVSTAILFKSFYRFGRTTTTAEALREAQLELKARPRYAHPAHWAGVTLTGDWE